MIPAEVASVNKVLVIDDELGPRESLRFLLKNEFEVLCADSVDKGISLLREKGPDLVIMDIRMPGKNGIDGLREIRAVDPNVSVMMLTGYGALETAQEAIRLGATDYLSKPFDTDDMRAAVRQYVKRSAVEKKRGEMLQQLEDINKQLVKDLADKECLESLARTSAEIAHDMRNPLMIVSGYVELLTDQIQRTREVMGDEYEKTSDYLEVIGENVRRCCDLAHMWQKFGKNKLSDVRNVPVADLIEDLKKASDPLAAKRGVKIAYSSDVGLAAIPGSRAQLIRALCNVVSNAIDAVSGPEARVAVKSCIVQDRVEIRVTDNGCGMSPETLSRVFEPYFTTKGEGKGTGLGMAIAKKVMEDHKGCIAVESVLDEGTTVILSMPVSPPTT
jgi:signal transduction histidine kinase